MRTQIERYIPPRFNRAILYTILLPEVIRTNKYDAETYVAAVTKFEIECEGKLKDLFKKLPHMPLIKKSGEQLKFSVKNTVGNSN